MTNAPAWIAALCAVSTLSIGVIGGMLRYFVRAEIRAQVGPLTGKVDLVHAELDGVRTFVEHELQANSGTSLRDAINRIEARIES